MAAGPIIEITFFKPAFTGAGLFIALKIALITKLN